MSLIPFLKNYFEDTTRQRGSGYLSMGRVQFLSTSPTELLAQVKGSKREPYNIRLQWNTHPNGIDLQVLCDCPHYGDGFFCKHIWATFLKMDTIRQETVPLKKPTRLLHKKDMNEAETIVDGNWIRHLEDLGQSSRQTSLHRNSAGDPPTRKIGEVWYLINLKETRSKGKLVLDFYHRKFGRSGKPEKLKPLKIQEGDIPSFPNPKDRQSMALLIGNRPDSEYDRYYYNPQFSRSVISIVLCEAILPKLAATEKLAYSPQNSFDEALLKPLKWEADFPWKFELEVNTEETKNRWTISGHLRRNGETRRMKEPLLLLREGIVLFPESVARMEETPHFDWIVKLRITGEMHIPFREKENFVKHFYQIPHAPIDLLPPELRLQEKRTEPVPVIRFLTNGRYSYLNTGQLEVHVSFDYGSYQTNFKAGEYCFVDSKTKEAHFRNPEKEREWVDLLLQLGCLSPPNYLANICDLVLHQKRIMDVALKLIALDCRVEMEGNPIHKAGHFDISVTSGVDWFDLSFKVDFDGVSVPFPKLLAVLRKGEILIQLDNNSQGILPEELLKLYQSAAKFGKISKEAIQYSKPQAALLDAVLAGQKAKIDYDATFRNILKQLQSFQGINPVLQPPTFRGKLRDYQKEGLGWLHFLNRFGFGGCLADDMGLGKTIQVLALLEERRRVHHADGEKIRPSLVVVPKSLVYNWIDETARFVPNLKVLSYSGVGRDELFEKLGKFHLIVTTYGTLRRDILKLKDIPFDYCILDEAQAIKNSNSQSAKAARLVSASHRLALTGTPIENHIGDIWSLFEFLNPGILGISGTFQQMAGNKNPEEASLQALAKGLRPFILRRTKKQVLKELPEKTEQTLFCELDRNQKTLYDELKDHYRASLTQTINKLGLNRSKIHILEALLRLRQAACHPGLLDNKRRTEKSAKLETLMEQLREILEEGHKALVFSQFTSLLSIVRERMDDEKIIYEYLDGKTQDRKARVERFQTDPDCRLFLVSLKAGGLGLNLTAADYIFILDPWWNPAVEAQAIDRAHRIGQTRNVFAYRLIAKDTVEEKILELQSKKRGLAEAILTENNSLIRSLTAEDLKILLS